MHRLLTAVILAYAGLSAAQWGFASRLMYAPREPGMFLCGNAISDPFAWILNVPAPLAASSAIIMVRRCAKTHQWPRFVVAALFAFVVTSALLAYEGYFLGRYGFEFDIWWLRWR